MGLFFYRTFYFLREAAKNIRHSLFLTTVSVSTIAVSLILVGFFAFVLVNANRFIDQIARDLRITVYVKSDATPEAIDRLVAQVKAHPRVEDVEFITRAQDRERSLALLSPQLLEGLDEASIPAQPSLEIRLEKRQLLTSDIDEITRWLTDLEAIDEVEDTLFGEERLRIVNAAIDLVKLAGSIISVIVLLAAVFFTFSTIKLAVYARQDEISVLRLVGATNRFIRAPFYLEGILQGIIGSVLAFVILLVVRGQLNTFILRAHALYLEFDMPPMLLMGAFFLGGVLLAVLGTALSVGRYLRR